MESLLNLIRAWQYKLLVFVQSTGKRLNRWINTLTVILSVIGIGNVIWQIGFGASDAQIEWLDSFNKTLIVIFGVIQVYKFVNSIVSAKTTSLWQIVYVVLVWTFIWNMNGSGGWKDMLSNSYVIDGVLILLSVNELSSLGLGFLTQKTSPTVLFACSFAVIIMIGTGLLLMPRCHYGDLTFLEALFTSTAMVCVAGMSVIDIASTFTPFGQTVILLLIQIGGLGVMTFTCFFALSLSGKASIQNRMVIKDLVSADNVSSIFETLKHIMYVTFIIEAAIAWILYYYFEQALAGYTPFEIVFTSAFHAISAFCNAGVSNLPDGLQNIHIQHSNWLHFVLALTIMFGAMGFPLQSAVINWIKVHLLALAGRILKRDLSGSNTHHRMISASNRLIFYANLIITFAGMAFFMISEAAFSQSNSDIVDRLTDSFFLSATTRTAGFLYYDIDSFSSSTIMIVCVLMWIGGAPMSTAGGIKVTTFSVAILNMRNILIGKEDIEIFGRRVSEASIRKAFTTIILTLIAIVVSTIGLKLSMPEVSTSKLTFESVAALSTAGMSMDITPMLNTPARLILIADMFIGRIGIMAFLLIFITPRRPQRYKYPTENVMI